MGQKITAPDAEYFADVNKYTSVLGAQTGTGAKHIYVDLSSQHLYAYQGAALVFSDLVATGKWNLTPTGTFEVWVKLQATLMAGGEGATAYYLPNVPWTMYFANANVGRSQGYSMHGEYWYNPDTGLGKPQSHGCVNMRISDAKALYDWIDPPTTGYTTHATDQNPGTLVTIYGTTPNQDLVGTQFYNHNVSPDAGKAL
jgi:lipoprotein-anchoring transpeptidase ErfK/SrfK